MFKLGVLLPAAGVLVVCGCSQRTGYEMLRQKSYLECLKNSLQPAEDCRYAPDFEQYQQERRRHPEGQSAFPERSD